MDLLDIMLTSAYQHISISEIILQELNIKLPNRQHEKNQKSPIKIQESNLDRQHIKNSKF